MPTALETDSWEAAISTKEKNPLPQRFTPQEAAMPCPVILGLPGHITQEKAASQRENRLSESSPERLRSGLQLENAYFYVNCTTTKAFLCP